MSADARAYPHGEGWDWTGSHDGPCRPGAPDHRVATCLSEKLQELQHCLGHDVRWLITPYEETFRLSGWQA